MSRWSIVALASAALSLAIVDSSAPASAQGVPISNPVMGGNLGVYFVGGGPGGPGGSGGSSLLTLDQAMAQGAVKIYQQRSITTVNNATQQRMFLSGPVAIENLSAQSLFIQVGDLLKGGLQDQVVARTYIVPPHSGRVSIDTLCVDPFRSKVRAGDPADRFSVIGALFPWRLAKLGILTGTSAPTATQMNVREVRQLGVWWSMDTLRDALARKLGVPLEPPVAASWIDDPDTRVDMQLAARHSNWRNSLPLSLENTALARAERPYLDALEAKGEAGDAVGAVFVINGQIEGADIYRSHALFAQMWPKLLRAYATEAIAYSGRKSVHTPTVERVREFLATAERAPGKEAPGGTILHESTAALYAVTGSNGAWVYRSYVAKHPTDRLVPEGAIVRILETGAVAGHPIATLSDAQVLLLHPGIAGHGVTASVEDVHVTALSRFMPFDPAHITMLNTVPWRTPGSVTNENSGQAQPGNPEADFRRALEVQERLAAARRHQTELIDIGLVVLAAIASLLFGLIRRRPLALRRLAGYVMRSRTAHAADSQQIEPREQPIEEETDLPAGAEAQPALVQPMNLSAYRQWRAAKAAAARRARRPVVNPETADRAQAA